MISSVLESNCLSDFRLCLPIRGFIYIKPSFGKALPCVKAVGKIQRILVEKKLLLLASLGPLGTVLGTGLHTAVDALGIQSAADDVVTNTGQVLDTAAADQNHGVLLQVVADAGDVSGNFHTVGQANTSDLTQCGVGLDLANPPMQRY